MNLKRFDIFFYFVTGKQRIVNKVDISNLKESKNIVKFIEYLNVLGMSAEYYETNGEDINAACGQMLADTKVTRRLLK